MLIPSSPEKNHDRLARCPDLATLVDARPPGPESRFLYPTPTGLLWRESNSYREVWTPARLATGLDPTPHEICHSYITNLRAEGVDDADVGQTVATMIAFYTHPLGRCDERVRRLIV
jgi:hypothetical protein